MVPAVVVAPAVVVVRAPLSVERARGTYEMRFGDRVLWWRRLERVRELR